MTTPPGSIQYAYALNGQGTLTHISDALRSHTYTCPGCKSLLTPVLGEINAQHFRHSKECCALETYLHKCGKEAFFYRYQQALSRAVPISLELERRVSCNGARLALVRDNISQCLEPVPARYNMTKFFDLAELEKRDKTNGLQPDVMLRDTAGKRRCYIEICVTHPCSQEKIDTGIPILEFKIQSAGDIQMLLSGSYSIKDKRLNVFNWHPPSQVVDSCSEPCSVGNLGMSVWSLSDSGRLNEKIVPLAEVDLLTSSYFNTWPRSLRGAELVKNLRTFIHHADPHALFPAFVAEQCGRRWITCDTSRVPLALARQRLLTATFPWYELKSPSRGPAGGFVYKRKQNRKGEEVGGLVPRITLKSIANNEEPETVTLVDRPETNNSITRVCGPFTVEATIQAAHSLEVEGATQAAEQAAGYNARSYLDRMIDILRRSHNLRLPGNRSLKLEQVRVLDNDFLHAEAVDEQEQRIAIVFGPEDGAISSDQVFEAASEAYFLKYSQLFFFGFAIQAKARELVDDRKRLRLPCTYISVTPDVAMDDLLKTSHTDQLFSITGLPDARITSAGLRDDGKALYQVELLGLDTFRPDTMATESVEPENLPCWMLDTSYNGMAFCASQVFFPRTGAWDNLQKSLKGKFNDSVWEHLAGTTSEPFVADSKGQIAIKVIDERGNELMRVLNVAEAE